MYKLSEASARDIENILERSFLDFGQTQTEQYYQSLKIAWNYSPVIRRWATMRMKYNLVIIAFLIRAM